MQLSQHPVNHKAKQMFILKIDFGAGTVLS